jgi:hypothetical protein
MAIDRVIAKVGLPTLKPLDERRSGVVADHLWRLVPVDPLGFVGPEGVAILDRPLVKASY